MFYNQLFAGVTDMKDEAPHRHKIGIEHQS